MPPKVKITRDMIIDAAFDIIRNEGSENLNARNIAARLNCSTQPVLYSFKTVDEIREAVYRKADEYHTSFILPKETDREPMLAMGLNYVRFGHEERNLFRFLFQSDKFTGMDIKTLLNNPALSEIINVMAQGLKVNKKEAKEIFLSFWCLTHGLASLLANNSMAYDEKTVRKILEKAYEKEMN